MLVGSVGTRKGRPANEGGGGASEDIPKRFLTMCSVAAEGPLHMALPGDHRQPRQRDQIARGRSSRAGGRSTKSAAQNIRVSRVHAGKRVSIRARAGKNTWDRDRTARVPLTDWRCEVDDLDMQKKTSRTRQFQRNAIV